eukprot:6220482-Prymnesium_polylepis.1
MAHHIDRPSRPTRASYFEVGGTQSDNPPKIRSAGCLFPQCLAPLCGGGEDHGRCPGHGTGGYHPQ